MSVRGAPAHHPARSTDPGSLRAALALARAHACFSRVCPSIVRSSLPQKMAADPRRDGRGDDRIGSHGTTRSGKEPPGVSSYSRERRTVSSSRRPRRPRLPEMIRERGSCRTSRALRTDRLSYVRRRVTLARATRITRATERERMYRRFRDSRACSAGRRTDDSIERIYREPAERCLDSSRGGACPSAPYGCVLSGVYARARAALDVRAREINERRRG